MERDAPLARLQNRRQHAPWRPPSPHQGDVANTKVIVVERCIVGRPWRRIGWQVEVSYLLCKQRTKDTAGQFWQCERELRSLGALAAKREPALIISSHDNQANRTKQYLVNALECSSTIYSAFISSRCRRICPIPPREGTRPPRRRPRPQRRDTCSTAAARTFTFPNRSRPRPTATSTRSASGWITSSKHRRRRMRG